MFGQPAQTRTVEERLTLLELDVRMLVEGRGPDWQRINELEARVAAAEMAVTRHPLQGSCGDKDCRHCYRDPRAPEGFMWQYGQLVKREG